MKRSFLEVRARSRELEMKKPNPTQTQNQHQVPIQSTYHLKLIKNPSKQIQTIFKLMKRSFLEVRAGSRELEMKKNQTQTQTNTTPTPKPKHPPFEIDEKTLPKQIQTIFKLMKRSFLEVKAGVGS